jgi:hypothetical protein
LLKDGLDFMARRYRAVWTSDREPAVPDSLKALTNVVLTPHIGGGAIDAREAMQSRCYEYYGLSGWSAVENTGARASLLNDISS